MFNKVKYDKEYWKKNGKKYDDLKKIRYANDPVFREKVSNQRKEWNKKNPEKVLLIQERVKGRRLRWRFEILKRDNFTCQYCGRKSPDVILHIDHIHPKSKGGLNILSNYKTACAECNIGKGDVILNL